MRRFRYLIVGGGFAGLATAYFLLKKRAGPVCLVEKERATGLGASGQNASMMCQASSDPTIAAMTARGMKLFKNEFLKTMPGIGFRQSGSVFLAAKRSGGALEALARNARAEGFPVIRMSRHVTLKRCPFLQKSAFDEALFFPRDGVADIRALTLHLTRFLVRHGGTLLLHNACAIERHDGGFRMIHAGSELRFGGVVNAAGAWAGEFARSAGAQKIPLRPTRRHIFLSSPLRWVDPRWPIVWDVSREVYGRPVGKRMLLSPCDEEDYPPGPVRTSPSVRRLLEKKISSFLPQAAGLRYEKSWAGLRTFAPDRRPVIGWDVKRDGFFWVAGLGGHGVTACASVGELAASLITEHRPASRRARLFSPKRFL